MNYYCKVCGRPLGRCAGWDLCTQCDGFYQKGNIIHTRSGYQWVYPGQWFTPDMIYKKKESIQSYPEKWCYQTIKEILPVEYQLLPQVAVSAVIERTDGAAFQSELNRVFDFLVVDMNYRPMFAIELNDSTHNTYERKQRDANLARICGEAGLHLEFVKGNAEQIRFQVKNALALWEGTKRRPYIYKVITPTPAQMSVPARPIQLEYSWGKLLFYTVFFGWLGLHRFYAGKMRSGMLYIFTLGLFGVGWIADVIRVLSGRFTDKRGNKITRKKR